MAVGQQNDTTGNQIGRQLYRFNLLTGYTSLGPIISASLQLEVYDNFAGIPCNTAVYGLSDVWNEMTVTWNTQPVVDSPEIDSVLINPPWPYGEVFEYDVTSYVMAQVLGGDSLISFQQRGQDETVVGGVRWWQREGEGVSMPPIVGKQPWLSIVLDAPWTNENIVIIVSEPITIAIDIKPGDDGNIINLRGMKTIPVAILSSAEFDAPSDVDQATLTFGVTGDEASFKSCARKPKDVNGDGNPDLVCQFSMKLEGGLPLFKCGDKVGILKGKTVPPGRRPFEGRQTVVITPCK